MSVGTQSALAPAEWADKRPYIGANYGIGHLCARQIWNIVFIVLFLPSPRPFHGWRRFLLRCFGAQIGEGSRVYPRARIWAPWQLQMGREASIADDAEIYNQARIEIDDYAVVSQGAYLCAASHDYTRWSFPLIFQPIYVGKHAWIAARAIVQMGVRIGEGTVVGAGSVVTKNLPDWTVCAGNPCVPLKHYDKRHN